MEHLTKEDNHNPSFPESSVFIGAWGGGQKAKASPVQIKSGEPLQELVGTGFMGT